MKHALFWIAALLSALHAAAQTPSAAAPRPEAVHPAWAGFDPAFTEHVCPFAAGLSYDPAEFVCGYVLVPEDRTDPDSRLIKLSVLKIVSTSEDPPAGAMVRLTGGPGGRSLAAGRIRAYQSPDTRIFREAADLVFFDQRGIGYSEAPICRGAPLPYQFGGPMAVEGAERRAAVLAQCLDEARRQGVAVDAYSTWQNALDVRDIRRALSYDQWTLFGVSYGTALAQAAMQVDPGGVRAAVLDSVVPAEIPSDDPAFTTAYGFRSSLDAVDAMCAADPGCADAFGSLSERFLAAFQALDEEPLIVGGLPPDRSLNGRFVVDGHLAAAAVFQALYVRDFYAGLPAILRTLETRDADALRTYALFIGEPVDHAFGHGMSWVTDCRSARRDRPDAVAAMAARAPDLVRWTEELVYSVHCDRTYTPRPDPSVRPLVSDVPVLVAAGLADPITPPSWSRHILPGLSNAQYVEVPYTGHGALYSHLSGCGARILRDFIVDPMSEVDARCIDEIEPPDFVVSLRRSQAPVAFAQGLQTGSYPVPALIAAATLILTLIGFPLGAAARRIDRDHAAPIAPARLLAWLGAAASLLGAAWAVRVILATGLENPIVLPYGVPSIIGWAGWLGLSGAVLASLGVVQFVRRRGRGHPKIGTALGLLATAAATIYLVVFLFSLRAGPI